MHGSVYSVALRGENHVILILTQFQKILRLGGGILCRCQQLPIKPKFSYLQQLNPQSTGHSGLMVKLLVSASHCGMRGPRFESHRSWRLCLSRQPLRYAVLGTGCALTTVPRLTQLCISAGSLNRVPASAGVRAGRKFHLCRVAGNTVHLIGHVSSRLP